MYFPFPPLSLATLAALTPREHEVVICDENVKPVDFDTDADIVGITGYHIQKERVYQLADLFRSKGKTVAIGGPLVQKSNLGECAEHADVVFLGEAEYTWPSFISDFQSGNAQPLYEQDGFVDLAASPAPPLSSCLSFRHIQQQSLKHRAAVRTRASSAKYRFGWASGPGINQWNR